MTYPVGFYRGTVLGPWWLRPFNRIWHGKTFYALTLSSPGEGLGGCGFYIGGFVLNRILGHDIIRGEIEDPRMGVFTIRYASWLKDEVLFLRPGEYCGSLTLGPVTVKFKLEAESAGIIGSVGSVVCWGKNVLESESLHDYEPDPLEQDACDSRRDALLAVVKEMRTIAMVAGQFSVEGEQNETALMAAAESDRVRRWADLIEAFLEP